MRSWCSKLPATFALFPVNVLNEENVTYTWSFKAAIWLVSQLHPKWSSIDGSESKQNVFSGHSTYSTYYCQYWGVQCSWERRGLPHTPDRRLAFRQDLPIRRGCLQHNLDTHRRWAIYFVPCVVNKNIIQIIQRNNSYAWPTTSQSVA